MKTIISKALLCAVLGASVLATGCAAVKGQETVGEFADDTVITTQAKARMVEDKNVSASAVSVETLKGVVQLSGFVKTQAEKARAEEIVRGVKHVKSIVNNIIVHP